MTSWWKRSRKERAQIYPRGTIGGTLQIMRVASATYGSYRQHIFGRPASCSEISHLTAAFGGLCSVLLTSWLSTAFSWNHRGSPRFATTYKAAWITVVPNPNGTWNG